MEIICPFDYSEVFKIIHPLARRMVKAGSSPNLTMYILADDFMNGKLGTIITSDIGNALWTLAHNSAKILVNQPEFNAVQQKALSTVAAFRDYMQTQGITLTIED